MRSGRIIITVATMLVAIGAPGRAQTVAPAGSVVATGTMTVDTSRTGRIGIQVPADATIDIYDTALRGSGRTFGFLLTEPRTKERFNVSSMHYPAAFDWGEHTITDGRKAVGDRKDGFDVGCVECHVPPGRYDLYVIADGAPVSVTITFEGLEGSTALGEADLTPIASSQIDSSTASSTVPALGETSSERSFCCIDVGQGLTFLQMTTSFVTKSTATASHELCLQRQGTERCSSQGWAEEAYVAYEPWRRVTFPIWEFDGSTYSLSSVVDASAGATELKWETDLDGVTLAY